MKVELWAIGKTNEPYLNEGFQLYEKRLQHYLKFRFFVISNLKKASKLSPEVIKEKEGDHVFKYLNNEDFLILLDENGKQMDSVKFARFMEHKLQLSHKRLVFLIGGAYGVSEMVKKRADHILSLSKMTFSHQMIRLFIIEQIYRAMTILKNEPYHNP